MRVLNKNHRVVYADVNPSLPALLREMAEYLEENEAPDSLVSVSISQGYVHDFDSYAWDATVVVA